MAVRENPKGNKEIQESREMSEVVFMIFTVKPGQSDEVEEPGDSSIFINFLRTYLSILTTIRQRNDNKNKC